MGWHFDQNKPLYLQIVDRIRTDIICGMYKPEEKLPGVRELAFEAEVNPNTMQRALSELEQEGLLITRGTSGRFVTDDVRLIENAKATMLKQLAQECARKFAVFGLSPKQTAELIINTEGN